MSYSIFPEDIIDIDALIDQIEIYADTFREYEKVFIHCKNVENFEKNLERDVPHLKNNLSEIYGSGRDLASSIRNNIYNHLSPERTGLLKTAIDSLERQLIFQKGIGESKYLKINSIYEESGYHEFSMLEMLSATYEMCKLIADILVYIKMIKSSYAYKVQSGEITMKEVEESMRNSTNTVNNSGNFYSSMLNMGNENTNTMSVNQERNEEITAACQEIIKIIDKSTASKEEKDTIKAAVHSIEEAKGTTELRDKYLGLIEVISNHITIVTPIISSGIFLELTKLVI